MWKKGKRDESTGHGVTLEGFEELSACGRRLKDSNWISVTFAVMLGFGLKGYFDDSLRFFFFMTAALLLFLCCCCCFSCAPARTVLQHNSQLLSGLSNYNEQHQSAGAGPLTARVNQDERQPS